MRRRQATVTTQKPYFLAATLAAGFGARDEAFSAAQVRFFVELFTNWMEVSFGGTELCVQSIQVGRFLDALVGDRIAAKTRGRRPGFRLTLRGRVRLLEELVMGERLHPLEQVFFVDYFLYAYSEYLEEFALNAGLQERATITRLRQALKEPDAVARRQLEFVDEEISKLEARIREATSAAEWASTSFAHGASFANVITEMQRRFPYELNAAKPLKELLAPFPSSFGQWELTRGLGLRAQSLWSPLLEYLRAYRAIVQALANQRKHR